MTKRLVAYFSASGVTKDAAQVLAKAAQADLYEIQPDIPYTTDDLDWMNKNSRSSVEMKDPSSRPEIAGKMEHMEDYSVIFLGFPIWWYTAPTIIKTFLESYDFAGKKIILFATSGGSGLGSSDQDLSAVCPDADIKNGKMLNGRVSEEELRQWVESLNL